MASHDKVGEAFGIAEFDSLYGRLLPIVYGYFLRRVGGDVALAEDLTQETFLAAVRGLPAAIESPEAWMMTVARRRFIDHLRRKQRRPRIVSDRVDLRQEGFPPDWSDDERRISIALARLKPSHRLVLVLHHVDGEPVSTVAETLGRSVAAVESLLARARRSLRTAFGEVDDA